MMKISVSLLLIALCTSMLAQSVPPAVPPAPAPAVQNSTANSPAAQTQSAPGQSTNQAADVDLVKKMVFRALDHNQGDIGSLNDAQNDFTPQAWSKFIRHMDGYLDARGAPLFNQTFTPAEEPVVVSRENGLTYIAIRGLLQQTASMSKSTAINSTVTYRSVIYVEVGGSPTKIQKLEQTMCGVGTEPCPIFPNHMKFTKE